MSNYKVFLRYVKNLRFCDTSQQNTFNKNQGQLKMFITDLWLESFGLNLPVDALLARQRFAAITASKFFF